MLADAVTVESTTLVAVTVSVVVVAMDAGAAYSPAPLILPDPLGLIDHVTAALQLPMTVAANCRVCPAERVAAVGATEIDSGAPETEIVAVPERLKPPLAPLIVTG